MKLIYTHFSMSRAFQPAEFFLLPLFLLTLISFSGTVSSVSAQTTPEVCRETMRVLKQYERELSEANESVRFKKYEDKMRQNLSTLQRAIASGTLMKQEILERLSLSIKLDLPKAIGSMTPEERAAFQRKAQSFMEQKIQEISDITLEDLNQKRDRLSQQLKIRQVRYDALNCYDVLTREKGNGDCQIEGRWTQYDTPGIPSTVWEIKSYGKATETGGGNAEGTANLHGKVLRLDWETLTGYAGYYQWTLNENCTSGEGKLKFTKPRTDTLKSFVRKQGQ